MGALAGAGNFILLVALSLANGVVSSRVVLSGDFLINPLRAFFVACPFLRIYFYSCVEIISVFFVKLLNCMCLAFECSGRV